MLQIDKIIFVCINFESHNLADKLGAIDSIRADSYCMYVVTHVRTTYILNIY